jgi:hypothetical protein
LSSALSPVLVPGWPILKSAGEIRWLACLWCDGIRSASTRSGPEGAIERADRLEAGIEGDGQDRHSVLRRIGESGFRLSQPVAANRRVERSHRGGAEF